MIKINNLTLWLIVVIAVAVFVFSGCAPEPPRLDRRCPGKPSVDQALTALENNARGLTAFKANGKCKAKFYEKDKKQPRNEQFPVKIWLEQPGNIRFLGDIAFNARGLDVGSNEQEFWFAAKPNELGNIYIWGKWAQQIESADLLLNPKFFLQAFGVIDVSDVKKWSLASVDQQDVLTQNDEQGRKIRRVYIDNCDYRVERIEYFDIDSSVIASMELNSYRVISGNATLPTKILIKRSNNDGSSDSFEITLNSISSQSTINRAIFKKPKTSGFKEVYRLIEGKAVQQKD